MTYIKSYKELETQIIIAKDLKMTNKDYFYNAESLLLEVLKMLNSMIAKMKQLQTEG